MKIVTYNSVFSKQVYGQTVTTSASTSVVLDGVRVIKYSPNKNCTVLSFDVHGPEFITGNHVDVITEFLADDGFTKLNLGDIPYVNNQNCDDDDDCD
jgi:hypothetical protein